jgi:hypothetical protein
VAEVSGEEDVAAVKEAMTWTIPNAGAAGTLNN